VTDAPRRALVQKMVASPKGAQLHALINQ
jgi:hypothetical protein